MLKTPDTVMMKWVGILVWCFMFVLQPAQASEDGFLDPEQAFTMHAEMSAPDVLQVRFKIAPDYYMYRERFSFKIQPKEIELGEPVFQQGKKKFDPTFNREMELYFNETVIRLPVLNAATTPGAITLTINGQGCAVAGLCYPPMDFIVSLAASADGKGLVVQGQQGLFSRLSEGRWRDVLFGANDEGLAGLLSSTGLFEIVMLFFVLGVLLALTPCVLPMVPILSVLLVGEQHRVTRGRGLVLAASYVAGMSLIYTALGIAAGLSGAGLAAWLQTPWVLGGFALLLAALALAMFDVFQFQMPTSIQTRLTVTNSHILGGRVVAALMMGALSALIVGPCVAAPLAGALLYISQTGDVILGGAALFAMAWGMGLPLLVMGASAGKLMPRPGAWMEGVKKFFGVLLFATAWWMVAPILPAWVQIVGWSVLAMLAAMLLRTFDSLPEDAGFGGVLRKTLGMLLVLICAIWLLGVASGGRSLLQPLSHLAVIERSMSQTINASQAGAIQPLRNQLNSPLAGPTSLRQQLLAPESDTAQKGSERPALMAQPEFERVATLAELDAILATTTTPVMLDFYADWCVSCKEMEAFTFVDPAVMQSMRQIRLLQVDVTANNVADRALLKRFRLFGPPGIIFFSPGGAERRDVRVVGFQDAARFAAILDRVLK
jgi:thiol:disulfide interchange protein DsbD